MKNRKIQLCMLLCKAPSISLAKGYLKIYLKSKIKLNNIIRSLIKPWQIFVEK